MRQNLIISEETISVKFDFIRNQKVLDRDLGRLFTVLKTKRLKEQVKNEIFPQDFLKIL
jgi:hypothetical protein